MSRRKRSYRSVDVKAVDRSRLAETVAGERLVFGIDVAKEKVYAALMGEDRKTRITIRWDLVDESREVVELLKELPAKRIEAAMEPTGTYGDPIRGLLQGAGIDVYRVSSKRSHDAAEVWDGVPSLHDPKSAEIVARLHWDGVSELWEERGEDARGMNAAVSIIGMHSEVYTKRLNQIEAQLARHWPELTRHLDSSGATILELLAEMGGPRAVRERPKEAAGLMRRVGRYFLSQRKIEAVLKSAQETIGVVMIEAEEHALKETAAEARRAQQLERDARVRVGQMAEQDDECKLLEVVTGKVTAAVFKAQLGSIAGYDNAASVEKAFGLNLKVKSSGKDKGQLKITKRGPSLSRRYLFLAALRLIQNDRIMGAWYAIRCQRNGGIKKKAVIAIMRKLAKALWHVARGEQFDARKLVDVRRFRVEAMSC